MEDKFVNLHLHTHYSIGDATIKKLEQEAKEQNTSIFQVISKGKELTFKELIKEITQESEDISLTDLIDLILDKTGMNTVDEILDYLDEHEIN